MKSIENRRARHKYFILETYEAGIALRGSEIKSIREGKADLRDSYCIIEDNEIFVIAMYIAPYEKSMYPIPTRRKRKLLLNKNEIKKLYVRVEERGFTLIPISLYLNENGKAKLQIALSKGKAKYEKREKIREREMKREVRRTIGRQLKRNIVRHNN